MTNEKDILLRAIDEFGIREQEDMMLEEMSELAKALLKVRRAESKSVMYDDPLLAHCDERVREEIADVQIMLDQMKMIYDHDGIIDSWREKKLSRLELEFIRLAEAREKGRAVDRALCDAETASSEGETTP